MYICEYIYAYIYSEDTRYTHIRIYAYIVYILELKISLYLFIE